MRCRALLSMLSLALPVVAGATVVVTPDGVTLPGTSASLDGSLIGTIVADRVQDFRYAVRVNPFDGPSFMDFVSGRVRSQVLHANDGSFDFYWQIQVAHGQLTNLTLDRFVASGYRADFRTDSPGARAPAYARQTGPGRVDFGFFPLNEPAGASLSAGETSRRFFLDTDAHAFTSGATYALNSNAFGNARGSSVSYQAFGPAPIPEPQTWALMLTGLLFVGWATRARAARRSGATPDDPGL